MDDKTLTDKRKRFDEIDWTDCDDMYTRVIGFRETHLEQPNAPDDAVAQIAIGRHRVQQVHSMGHHRERKWIELDGSYLTAEQAVETALLLLDAASGWRNEQVSDGPPVGAVADDDPRRWELHVHACSIKDLTFWVRRRREDGQWEATEVETGVTGDSAATPREAMENYWNG